MIPDPPLEIEPFATEMLPFFVYGTLLSGEFNAARLHPFAACVRPAHLRDAYLFDLGPYPMLLEAPSDMAMTRVLGEVVDVACEYYAQTLRALDRLEGVNGAAPASPRTLYRRLIREVEVAGAQDTGAILVRAWVYFGREDLARRGHLVTGGDWKRRHEGHIPSKVSRGNGASRACDC